MKKEYIKPSVEVLEFENDANILTGSLNGKVDSLNGIEYGGDTADGDLEKDGDKYIWGD